MPQLVNQAHLAVENEDAFAIRFSSRRGDLRGEREARKQGTKQKVWMKKPRIPHPAAVRGFPFNMKTHAQPRLTRSWLDLPLI